MFDIFGEVIFLLIDKITDKIANYIRYKELEKRIKIK